MANMTDATENEVLDGILGVTQLTTPPIAYLALLTGDPTDTGSVVNEVAIADYQRLSLAGLYSASSGGSSTNTSAIIFPTAVADWGIITHLGIMKSGVKGTDDMSVHLSLVTAIEILASDVFEMLTGKLTITAD